MAAVRAAAGAAGLGGVAVERVNARNWGDRSPVQRVAPSGWGVSEEMLSQNVQTLERDGMVVRDVRTTIPPRVEYSLTVLGVKIATRLRGLADLLEASMEEVLAARAAFDR